MQIKRVSLPANVDAMIRKIRTELSTMDEDARLEVLWRIFDGYCIDCGTKHPAGSLCHCFNDE